MESLQSEPAMEGGAGGLPLAAPQPPQVPRTPRALMLLGCILLAWAPPVFPESEPFLKAFSDPSLLWGKGPENTIEEAYRQCFKTYIIAGKIMNLRLPFAENNERDKLSRKSWEFIKGGKGGPALLWPLIDQALHTDDFARYVEALGDGREKVILFDIPERTWTISQDLSDLARMKVLPAPPLPHRPVVLVSGRGITEPDVYNYLYCVGWAGIDCSGFVWHLLSSLAAAKGLDLDRALRRALGAPPGADSVFYAGTWFFGSRSSQLIPVEDRIANLRPGDVLLFRGSDGEMAHSALIQSVNPARGEIRYLQSTDEAPPEERGVHESFIYFDPAAPETTLKDPALRWTQRRAAPFPGEPPSPFSDDGQRYRAYEDLGGGAVVRLRLLGADK